MAKVFLSFSCYARVDYSDAAVDKLNSNNIPFEVSENEIYLINKQSYDSDILIESGKNNYEPYETFCMSIAESTESSITMGRGGIDKSLFSVLYEVFDDTLEFQMTLDCNSETQIVWAYIKYDEEKEKYYFESEIKEDYDEDYDEEW